MSHWLGAYYDEAHGLARGDGANWLNRWPGSLTIWRGYKPLFVCCGFAAAERVTALQFIEGTVSAPGLRSCLRRTAAGA